MGIIKLFNKLFLSQTDAVKATIDEELKKSQLEKNEIEIERAKVEIEKIKAETQKLKSETRNVRQEGWTKAYTNIVSWALLVKAVLEYAPKVLQSLGIQIPWPWP